MSATIASLAARMLCAGFDGPSVPSEMAALLRAGLGGAVLFARNVVSPQQVAELNRSIKQIARGPVMICVDHEGGRVRRLRAGFSSIPSMRELGRAVVALSGSDHHLTPEALSLAHDIGTIIGQEVRAVGFDVDFAPVLDVDSNPDNPVIADRSLHADPHVVAQLGAALIDAIQAEHVAACGKHFPGHGDTSLDSHHALPRLEHDLRRLEQIELAPFAACAHAASMMTSHIVFSHLDPVYPATLSPRVLQALLRDRLGFDGVVFTDDMEMKAIASHFGFDDAVVRAVEAGSDVLTICHHHERQLRAIEVLVKAVEAGRLTRERLEQSVARIDRLCAGFVRSADHPIDLSVLDSDEHRRTIERVTTATEQAALDPTEAWQA